MSAFISDKRLCLTADGKVCDCDSPEAVQLLVGAGSEVSPEVAQKYGLKPPAPAKAEPEEKAVNTAPQNKAVEMPKGKK